MNKKLWLHAVLLIIVTFFLALPAAGENVAGKVSVFPQTAATPPRYRRPRDRRHQTGGEAGRRYQGP